MPSQFLLKISALLAAVVLCLVFLEAWRADQRDRAQLNAELAATKQLLAAADARQHHRDSQLAQTLAALAAEKRTIVTPAQIVRELPREIPLPAPIALQTLPTASPGAGPASTGQPPASPESRASKLEPAQTNAVIPSEDLKPLYDFTLDCKACQARLAAAQADLADERQKTAALTQERDHALQIAHGGSVRRRIARAAKWFVIGAAAGAIAAKATH